jgi:chromosome segregation ATPase
MSDYFSGLLRTFVKRAGQPIWSRFWPRVETVAARHANRVAGELRAELAELRGELRAEVAGMRDTLTRLSEAADKQEWTENEVRRMAPQVAAVDQRVASLERPGVDGAETPAARELVEEIRAEHARVRARLSAMAMYEQRIMKVEQAVSGFSSAAN